MKTSAKGLVNSNYHIQDVDYIMCGLYGCNCILERAKGQHMTEILLDFWNPEANEWIIEMFAVARTGGATKWIEELADELHKPAERKF